MVVVSLTGDSVKSCVPRTIIGEGAYGKVYECMTDDGQCVVKKIINCQSDDLIDPSYLSEMSILQALRNTDVTLKFYGAYYDNNDDSDNNHDHRTNTSKEFYILLEFASQGDLTRVVKDRNCEGLLSKFIEQVGSALQHLHCLNIIHNDLRPANIVMTDDNRFKIIDFGRSGPANRIISQGDIGGVRDWVSPELLVNRSTSEYNLKAIDLWSFGLCCVYLFTGDSLWCDDDDDDIIKHIIHWSEYSTIERHTDEYNPIFKKFVEQVKCGTIEGGINITLTRCELDINCQRTIDNLLKLHPNDRKLIIEPYSQNMQSTITDVNVITNTTIHKNINNNINKHRLLFLLKLLCSDDNIITTAYDLGVRYLTTTVTSNNNNYDTKELYDCAIALVYIVNTYFAIWIIDISVYLCLSQNLNDEDQLIQKIIDIMSAVNGIVYNPDDSHVFTDQQMTEPQMTKQQMTKQQITEPQMSRDDTRCELNRELVSHSKPYINYRCHNICSDKNRNKGVTCIMEYHRMFKTQTKTLHLALTLFDFFCYDIPCSRREVMSMACIWFVSTLFNDNSRGTNSYMRNDYELICTKKKLTDKIQLSQAPLPVSVFDHVYNLNETLDTIDLCIYLCELLIISGNDYVYSDTTTPEQFCDIVLVISKAVINNNKEIEPSKLSLIESDICRNISNTNLRHHSNNVVISQLASLLC